MLSIIVPIYNVEAYLPKCIKSVLSQSSSDFELLLIDDGSTDGSGKICDEYAEEDSRIRVFHKKNGGVSSARNLGIEKARGQYISFLDSDDWVAENYVFTILNGIKGFDLLFFSNKRCFDDGSVNEQCHKNIECFSKEETENLIDTLKFHNVTYEYFGFTWNKCFRRDIIINNNIRFVDGLRVREDEVFTNMYCRYISSSRFIQNSIYNYFEKSGGLTNCRKSEEEWFLLCKSMDESTEGIDSYVLRKHEKEKILKFYFCYLIHPNYTQYECMCNFYIRNREYFKDIGGKTLFLKLPKYVGYPLYSLYSSLH